MGNIAAYSAISSGAAILAEVVSTNFDKIRVVLDNGGLNSVNYGDGTIVSAKLADGAVVADKVSASQIRSQHMDFRQASSGVRVVQFANAASAFPANGVRLARVTATFAIVSNVTTASQTISFSQAMDGDPAFTATPGLMGVPVGVMALSDYPSPSQYDVHSVNSDSMVCSYTFAATRSANATVTVHVGAVGAF